MVNGFVSPISFLFFSCFICGRGFWFLDTCPALKAVIDTPSIMYSVWFLSLSFKIVIPPIRRDEHWSKKVEEEFNALRCPLCLIHWLFYIFTSVCPIFSFHLILSKVFMMSKFPIKILAHTKPEKMVWRSKAKLLPFLSWHRSRDFFFHFTIDKKKNFSLMEFQFVAFPSEFQNSFKSYE